MRTQCIDLPVSPPGRKPSRPSKPRKPREVSTRIEEVWSSENSDCTLAEILSAIPNSVSADSIFINVERNPNGYLYTRISYTNEMPNTKYADQLCEYERKLKKYERDLKKYEQNMKKWEFVKEQYDTYMENVQRVIEEEFALHVA